MTVIEKPATPTLSPHAHASQRWSGAMAGDPTTAQRPDVGLLGQERALEQIRRWLDTVANGPASLVVRGDAGSGKTATWRAAIREAVTRDFCVLEAHATESEQLLAYAGLSDLLEPIVGHFDDLPGPQVRALRIALLLEDPEGPPPDQRAVSTAVLSLLRRISGDRPVIVAVDDGPCLDAPTTRVLQYALRRLVNERVGVITTRRSTGAERAGASGLDWQAGPVQTLVPEPLGQDDIERLLTGRMGRGLPVSVLGQVTRSSGGNPLFALEVARAIVRGDLRVEPGQRLPVPETLRELIEERLSVLSEPVRALLAVTATLSEPSAELLARLMPGEDVDGGLRAAAAAGVLDVGSGRLQFSHPLYASILYHGQEPQRRRDLHRQLADVVTSQADRARHLSLAAEGPDERVASALDLAASAAARRGAPDAAAELNELAARLTPSGHPRGRERLIEAAEHHFAAGDTGRSRQILEELVGSQRAGPERADVLRRLARVRYQTDSCAVAASLLSRALAEAPEDPAFRAGVERELAWAIALCGDVREAARHAEAALAWLARGGGAMHPDVAVTHRLIQFVLGRKEAGGWPDMRDDRQPESDIPVEWRSATIRAVMAKWSGDLDVARRLLTQLEHEAKDAGDETSLPYLLSHRSEAASWAGEWPRALAIAEEARGRAMQTDQEQGLALSHYAVALAQAHLGRVDEARASATAGLQTADRVGSVWSMMLNQSVLGFVELSLDRPSAALDHLGPLVAWLDVVGVEEPGVFRVVPETAEALVAVGDLRRADALLRPYEARAAALGRTWAVLSAARVRAMLDAHESSPRVALMALERQTEELVSEVPPFERARTSLVLGALMRRTRRRRDTRLQLEAAVETFDRLGAVLWSAKARGFMTAGASRARAGEATSLTRSERQVADLVAAGLPNRAVADRLFVSVRTVEVHLTSIYRKLGLSSRTQLAARLAAAQQTVHRPSQRMEES